MRFGPPPRMIAFLRSRVGLALVVVGRIEVRRLRGELGGAGVDALEHRAHIERAAFLRDRLGGIPGEFSEAGVGEALRLEPAECARRGRQALFANLGLGVDQAADLGQEPGIDLAGRMDFRVGEPQSNGLRHLEDAVLGRRAEGCADRILVVALAEPFDLDFVEAG